MIRFLMQVIGMRHSGVRRNVDIKEGTNSFAGSGGDHVFAALCRVCDEIVATTSNMFSDDETAKNKVQEYAEKHVTRMRKSEGSPGDTILATVAFAFIVFKIVRALRSR